MSVTIEFSHSQLPALRRSLLAARKQLEESATASDARSRTRLAELDEALSQLTPMPESGSVSLTGSRAMLWDAVYDALCEGAEDLLETCVEYWRGTVTPAKARGLVAAIDKWISTLESLGPPQGQADG